MKTFINMDKLWIDTRRSKVKGAKEIIIDFADIGNT